MQSAFGFVVLNKPPRMTSRQAVDCVKKLVRPAKTGHAGTLDPLAAGILVVGVGPATRLIDRIQALGKRYTATFLLGRHSPTDDLEGEVTELPDAPQPNLADVQQALPPFIGQIMQRPPVFSAMKVEGKRSYELARKGRAVELAERPVMIHSLNIVRYDYPELVLEIACGSGTYVRSLGRDLAASLGTAALMSNLVRTAIGQFDLSLAVSPLDVTAENLAQHLRPATLAVQTLPTVVATLSDAQRLANGLPMTASQTLPADAREIAAVDLVGQLLAVLVPRAGQLWPTINFRQASDV